MTGTMDPEDIFREHPDLLALDNQDAQRRRILPTGIGRVDLADLEQMLGATGEPNPS